MSTDSAPLSVGGFEVEVVRKPIKNLHLGVYPPHGRVRVAAPLEMGDEAVRLAVVTRLAWIKRQQAKFAAQPRQSERLYISGETHFFLGRRYRLNLIEGAKAGQVEVPNSKTINLNVREDSNKAIRERIFLDWYRMELRTRAQPLVERWAAEYGIAMPHWGIRRMKTKWGTCNIEARRLWLNLELIKKPPQCLDYVIAHEFAHFFERSHSEQFVAILDRMLPNWRLVRDELNGEPLANEEWSRDPI